LSMNGVFFVPLALQAILMIVDEAYFHRARGLPRWERVGHPLDTLTVAACFACVLFTPPSALGWKVYVALAAFSTLFVTKDEFVHARLCTAKEHWLHSLLFILHPVVFFGLADLWPRLSDPGHAHDAVVLAVRVQFAAILGFVAYQIAYWNLGWKRTIPANPA
jgi:hypothetical protein